MFLWKKEEAPMNCHSSFIDGFDQMHAHIITPIHINWLANISRVKPKSAKKYCSSSSFVRKETFNMNKKIIRKKQESHKRKKVQRNNECIHPCWYYEQRQLSTHPADMFFSLASAPNLSPMFVPIIRVVVVYKVLRLRNTPHRYIFFGE